MRTGAVVALALAAIALPLAIGRLTRGAADGPPVALERLIAPERLAGRTVAAFTLASDGKRRQYLRSKGLWRARDAFAAVCDTAEVEAFLRAVLDARGTVVCTEPACGALYGFGSAGSAGIALHGPRVLADEEGDVLAALEYAPPASGTAFARRSGEQSVLAVDRDPRALLTSAEPFLDTRVLAGALAPGFAGFERIFVEVGERGYEIVSDAPEREGVERRWFLSAGGARQPASTWRVGGYVSLWVRLRWDAVLDPRGAAALGLDPPHARITLKPSTGAPFEVRVSAPDAASRVHLQNGATGVVAAVRAELLPLLVPGPADFTGDEGPNPWESWLAPR